MAPKKSNSSASVGMAATSGIIWTLVQTFSGKISIFVGQLILAKILAPEDFGVLGLAYTIATLFSVLSDAGIGPTIQQRQPRMHLWSTQAFWTTLILCSVSAVAMAVYAPIGAKLYHDDRITILIWILALNLPLGALWTLPLARLQSQLQFSFMAAYSSVEAVAAQVLTILCAWKGLGALSFVLPIPFLTIIRTIVYWIVAPVPLRPLRLSRGWAPLLKRSSGIFGSAILTIAISQGDYMTLGFLATTQVVGYYYFAFKLSSQPMIMLSTSFSNVLRPALLVLKNEPARQRDAALKTAELIGLMTVAFCYLQAAITRPGLMLLFGDRWAASIPLAQILSISFSLSTIPLAATALLLARGRNALSFKYQVISTPFFFILIGAGALLDSALGVSVGVLIYYTFQPIFFTARIFVKEGVGLRSVLSLFYRPVILAGVTIGGAYLLSLAPMFDGRPMAQMVLIMLLGGGTYVLAVRSFAPHIYREVLAKLSKLLNRSASFPLIDPNEAG